MAIRPVFIVKTTAPFYTQIDTEFKFYTGFAQSQRIKSVDSLHAAFHRKSDAKILEVSRFSTNILGQKLSAFNLLYTLKNGTKVPVENAFQSSKVFSNGLQCCDLLYVSPMEAKSDPRLKINGPLSCFKFQDEVFPLEPKTFFYDWIYINALINNVDTCSRLLEYDAFTDIVFNPEKAFNCQARTVAIYVSLVKSGMLSEAIKSADSFKNLAYTQNYSEYQMSLFD